MRQRKTFLFITSLLLCTVIGTAGIASAAELSPRQKQLNNQSVSCKTNQDLSCAKICTVAAQNPENADLGKKCDQSYRAALEAKSKPKAQPQPRPLEYTLRDQAQFCRMKKDKPCFLSCAAAAKNAGDAAAVQQCNAEYQRVLAANPPRPQRPEESMTLAQRIALMPDKAAYCKAKKAVNTERGMRGPLDGCITTCGDKRVTDQRYPEGQRESFVSMCEGTYYPIFQKLGK